MTLIKYWLICAGFCCALSLSYTQNILHDVSSVKGYGEYANTFSPVSDSINFYQNKMRTYLTPSERKATYEQYQFWKDDYKKKLIAFVAANTSEDIAAVAVLASGYTQSNVDFKLADSLAQSIAAKGSGYKFTTLLREEIEGIKNYKDRKIFTDFTLKDSNGKSVTFSDVQKKNTLLVFWASWCSTCRGKNQELKKLYTAYKSKGFEIVSVSVDAARLQWLKAAESDGISWINLWAEGAVNNIVGRKYTVFALPRTFLFDQNGQLVEENISMTALAERLDTQ